MMLLILTLMTSAIALSLFLAMNPLTIGLMILMMALILAMTFAYSMSSWIAFLIFLIYIGGMLVMFSYFVSMIPNQSLMFTYNASIMCFSFLCILFSSITLNIKPMTLPSYSLMLDFMYTKYNILMLLLLAITLLFTMVVVVKLTILSKGPLRPFTNYV